MSNKRFYRRVSKRHAHQISADGDYGSNASFWVLFLFIICSLAALGLLLAYCNMMVTK